MQAAAILQLYLDEMGQAVLACDFDAYASRVCLPFYLLTATGNMVVSDLAALRLGFDTFDKMLKTQRVTDYVRLVSQATQIDDALVSGHYVTHVMSHSLRIVPPFPSQIVLRRNEAGVWQGASITNGLNAESWPVYSIKPQEGPQP